MDSNHRPPGYGPGELPLLHPTVLEGNPAEGPCLPPAPPRALHGSGFGPPGAPSFPLKHHASPIPRPPKRLRGERIPNAFLRGNGTTHTASTPRSPDLTFGKAENDFPRPGISPASAGCFFKELRRDLLSPSDCKDIKISRNPNIFSRFTKILSFSPKNNTFLEKQAKISPRPASLRIPARPLKPFGRSQRSTEVPPRPSSHSSRFHVHPDAVSIPEIPPHFPINESRCAPRIPAGGGLRPRSAPVRTPCAAIPP